MIRDEFIQRFVLQHLASIEKAETYAKKLEDAGYEWDYEPGDEPDDESEVDALVVSGRALVTELRSHGHATANGLKSFAAFEKAIEAFEIVETDPEDDDTLEDD